jgi:hypothetical protein
VRFFLAGGESSVAVLPLLTLLVSFNAPEAKVKNNEQKEERMSIQ